MTSAMTSTLRISRALNRHLGSAVIAAILAVGLGGCQTTAQAPDVTGSVNSRSDSTPNRTTSTEIESLGERYRANPKNADVALQYGTSLRLNGQRQQAVAVLEQASIVNAGNRALLAAYGRALADNGNYQQAFDTLTKAHTPANPDWRILSVQGTVLDKMGKHDEARRYYTSALKIAPDEPSVLSNLGMSYVLSKDLPKAESTLRTALDRGTSDVRVRQNLGLAIGLQGRFSEAETIVSADLPADEAEANVAYLKQMLNRGEGSRRGPRTSAASSPNAS